MAKTKSPGGGRRGHTRHVQDEMNGVLRRSDAEHAGQEDVEYYVQPALHSSMLEKPHSLGKAAAKSARNIHRSSDDAHAG